MNTVDLELRIADTRDRLIQYSNNEPGIGDTWFVLESRRIRCSEIAAFVIELWGASQTGARGIYYEITLRSGTKYSYYEAPGVTTQLFER